MKKINYESRNFVDLRTELINYAREYYPEILNDFNDASIGIMLLELNAAIGDNLAYHTDRMFQETQIDYAQEKRNILALARTYGLKVPFKKPSISVVDVSCIVPVNGDTFDVSYAPLILKGAQFNGSGKIFESISDIDFSSPFGHGGLPNRLVLPRLNSNGDIISYELVKREIVVNGSTKIFSKTISQNEAIPFFEMILPDQDVLSIESVIALQGTSFSETPNNRQFNDFDLRYFEVNSLAEDKIFVVDKTVPSDNFGVPYGKYVRVNKKFISEYTDNGFLKLTFGNGVNTALEQLNLFTTTNQYPTIQNYLNNFSLGRTLKPNSTIFIQYRVGGGQNSNLGVNTINQIGTNVFKVNNGNEAQKTAVINSLRVNNAFPAIGGAGLPTIEEVRNFVSYNFAAQKRAVTIRDYESIIRNMPSEFGSPAKVSVQEVDNKIEVLVLSFDSNGRLTNTISNILTNNIANYLSNYRMINDYIVVKSATIIDVSVDCSVIIAANFNSNDIINSIISTINLYFSPQSMQLGTDVNLSEIKSNIQKLNGVFTVSDLTIINEVGGNYSGGFTSMEYSNTTTKTIKPIDEMIYAQPSEVYHIRYPDIDIRVKVKTSGNVTIG
jgi:hypothetical protein